MDMQNRAGAKAGGGGVASHALVLADTRNRQRRLAIESTDLSKDPYLSKNHIGVFECRLCLTMHTNEGSYLAHTQGKKHQTNLLRKNNREGKDLAVFPQQKPRVYPKKLIKIGRPQYKVVKQKDPATGQYSLLFEVEFKEIERGLKPRHRVMSCYEQTREPVDPRYQYVLFAADPYEIIAFKIPNLQVDSSAGNYYCHWDEVKKIYTVQLTFKNK